MQADIWKAGVFSVAESERTQETGVPGPGPSTLVEWEDRKSSRCCQSRHKAEREEKPATDFAEPDVLHILWLPCWMPCPRNHVIPL